MVSFANPIEGVLHPKGWLPPAGSLDMYVFRDCADHQATKQGCALDINNGRCDGKVLAVAAGTVRDLDPVQGIVRIVHADGSVSGYAHMSPILVVQGQTVTEGQQIGEIGDAHDPAITNFSGCHLHFGFQLAANAPEVDPWPLLRQNQSGADMDPSFSPKPNRTVTVNAGARHRLAPTTADPANIAIASDPGGPLGGALNLALMGTVVGEAVSGNAIWYAYWRPETKKVYYLHTSTTGPETPWEATGGHTDQELQDTARKAGHNAAVDVAAVGTKALADTAAKYP